jgi:hypothetical protein
MFLTLAGSHAIPSAFSCEPVFPNWICIAISAVFVFGLVTALVSAQRIRRLNPGAQANYARDIAIQLLLLSLLSLLIGAGGLVICVKKVLSDIPAKGITETRDIASSFEWALKPMFFGFASSISLCSLSVIAWLIQMKAKPRLVTSPPTN